MKHKLLLTATLSLLGLASLSSVAIAAPSQDECAIWLCLPSGFPSGCEGAKSALKHRLKRGKSALPRLPSCMVKDEHSDPKDFTHTERLVLKIKQDGKTTYQSGRSCRIKHGGGKDATYTEIPGCVGVFLEIKVFEKGKLVGKPYYVK